MALIFQNGMRIAVSNETRSICKLPRNSTIRARSALQLNSHVETLHRKQFGLAVRPANKRASHTICGSSADAAISPSGIETQQQQPAGGVASWLRLAGLAAACVACCGIAATMEHAAAARPFASASLAAYGVSAEGSSLSISIYFAAE